MADRFYRDIELPNFAPEKVVAQPDVGFIQLYGKNGFLVVSSNGNEELILNGAGVQDWAKKTTTYTAENGNKIIADTTGGSFTITLPATPTEGHFIQIVDGGDWATNNLTIARNGSTIENVADDLLADIKGVGVDLVYDGTTWEVFTTIGPAGPTGATGATGPQGVQSGLQDFFMLMGA